MTSPILDAYAALGEALDGVRRAVEEHLHGVGDSELLALLRTHHRAEARLDALGLDLVSYADMREIAHRCGASSTAAWLSGVLTMSPHAAVDRVRTARAMEAACPWTYENLASGDIAYEQASAIASIVTDLPKGADERQRGKAERYLLDRAPTSNALELRKLHKRVDDLIDPDGLLTRERTAQKKRDLTVRDNHDGTQSVRWTDTDERIAKFKAALGPLAAPQPAADGTRDERAPGQRRADAMTDFVERALRFGDIPSTRGHRAHIVVTISERTCVPGPGSGPPPPARPSPRKRSGGSRATRTCTPCTSTAMASPCDSGEANASQAPDSGSPSSPATAAALDRVALGHRNGPRPTTSSTGNTSDQRTSKICLVCDFHHDQVHHGGWEVWISPDGRPEFVPPETLDPYRRPIRNTHWHRERGAQPSQRAA